MKKHTFAILTFLSIVFYFASCKEKNTLSQKNENDNIIALLNKGDFFKATDELYFMVCEDKIVYFTFGADGFSTDKFMLHFIKEDGTFLNADFLAANASQFRIGKKKEQQLHAMEVPLTVADYKGIRTGQYRRDADGYPINIWATQIEKSTLGTGKNPYLNQLDGILGINVMAEQLNKDLAEGVFFQNPFGFYVLLGETDCYLITSKNTNIAPKIMLHYVRKDHSFENYSFQFESNEISKFLGSDLVEWRIAKVRSPKIEYHKIRFGQFNSNGNIWAQEVWPDELWSNPLLKYDGELKEKMPK